MWPESKNLVDRLGISAVNNMQRAKMKPLRTPYWTGTQEES